jgi:hypothetical protein
LPALKYRQVNDLNSLVKRQEEEANIREAQGLDTDEEEVG